MAPRRASIQAIRLHVSRDTFWTNHIASFNAEVEQFKLYQPACARESMETFASLYECFGSVYELHGKFKKNHIYCFYKIAQL